MVGQFFLRDTQFRAEGCQEGWRIHGVVGDTVRIGFDKALQFARIIAGNPARQLIFCGCNTRSYTVFMLQAVVTTSNCSVPTAPSNSMLPKCGRKTWIAPSSPQLRQPQFQLLAA